MSAYKGCRRSRYDWLFASKECSMAAESSQALAPGRRAPDSALPDPVSGRTIRLPDFAASPAVLVTFICNHCPYVIHIRPALVEFAREYQPRGLAVVAISANDADSHTQ